MDYIYPRRIGAGGTLFFKKVFLKLNTLIIHLNNVLKSQVKDCYIMPLGKDQEVPAALLPLEGQGLPSNRPNLLLSILVTISNPFIIASNLVLLLSICTIVTKCSNLGENQTSEAR